MTHIVVLPGDGIGPEVTAQAVQALSLLSRKMGLGLTFVEQDFGGIAIDHYGDPLPPSTLNVCKQAHAILLGAVGGDKWDDAPIRPETGLLRLRAELGLFANLRPGKVSDSLLDLSPLRADVAKNADILVVRELTGGIYFGEHKLEADRASDECAYSREEIERIAHVAFRAARKRGRRVTSVDKANVLATSKLWRAVVNEVARAYPDVTLDHMYVDACAMALVTTPRRFDVILTDNLFGDILSDELSVIGGAIGLLGSSSIGSDGPALFEPIHGSAPTIAGLNVANPVGALASAAMLLRHIGQPIAARMLEDAIDLTLAQGHRTADLGGHATCSEFGERVCEHIRASDWIGSTNLPADAAKGVAA